VPKFSIITPLYNKEKDIKNTLLSVLDQSFKDFEVIVINDGSTDNSEEIVKSVSDKRIFLYTKKNEGVSKARNYGVEKASSNYIAFLDADDYWYPNHLENLDFLITKYPNNSWYASAYEKKRNNSLTTPMLSPIINNGGNWFGEVDDFFGNSLIDCLAWTSAVCMKKDFFISLIGFDITITNGAGEDTDLWLRAALKSLLIFSNTISARHNLDGSNRISNIPTLKRSYMNLDKYDEESKKNIFLKKYLDLNRYSFAIQHKLANDLDSFNNYFHKIDLKNLNNKQQFLLRQNRFVLILLIRLKNSLEKVGFRVSSFS